MDLSMTRSLEASQEALNFSRRELDRMRPDKMLDALKDVLSQAKKAFQYNSPLARMERERQKLHVLGEKLKTYSPEALIDVLTRKLEKHREKIQLSMQNVLDSKKQKLEMQEVKLGLLNPKNVLAKGYSILTTQEGEIVHTANVRLGSVLKAKLFDGTLTVEVKDKEL